MKTFHCSHCQNLIYFENTRCLECDYTLAYLPDRQTMSALQPGTGGTWSPAQTSARVSPLPGLIVWKVFPDRDATHFPPMKCLIGLWARNLSEVKERFLGFMEWL